MDQKTFWNGLLFLGLFVLLFAGVRVATVVADTEKAGEVSSVENEEDGNKFNVILLNNKGYKKKRKGPVEFTHKKHAYNYRLFCWDCHHDYKNGQNVWVPWGETKRCDQCHDPKEKEPNEIMLQKAFHYQCKGCHKDFARKNMKTGAYRKCAGCHLKKESSD